MNEDLSELLALLKSHEIKFIVIGAHALAFHGRPRLTEDVDLWIERTGENVRRLALALEEFGAGIGDDGAHRFASLDRQIIRIGAPPNMVDILNFAGNEPFAEVWNRRVAGELNGVDVFFPSREDLTRMKRAAGRPQDLADIDRLN